ncbi:hypothetical protein [Phreatobacter stygius]|uniref:Uncharacterized protein n=1 Tax=Phreatobacter stygius TaxID=1940610 RepID=A0A4D7AW31_9HYPH|nr:hypothetical protein [Phreatobacter stygius]QCI64091.1 hypothetical protein E8M01_07440 [Phreatobacter stygius]
MRQEAVMLSGSFTETIWHFAGYLRIFEDTWRDPERYDGNDQARIREDAFSHRQSGLNRFEDDELEGKATRPPAVELSEPPVAQGAVLRADMPVAKLAMLPSPKVEAAAAPKIQPATIQAEVHSGRAISVEYTTDVAQLKLDIRQLNTMTDNDRVTDNDVVIVGASDQSADLSPPNTAASLDAMVRAAEGSTPASLVLPISGGGALLPGFVAERDAQWKAGADSASDWSGHRVEAGRYVDGVLTQEAVAKPAEAPSLEPAAIAVTEIAGNTATSTLTGPSHGIGTTAVVGANAVQNVAVIFDGSEMTGSLIVTGDAFFSKAIIQVNIFVDSDYVEASAPAALQALSASGNEVHNIAEFVTHESTIKVAGAFATARWKVDSLDGNFYDVKSIQQTNHLVDNDITVQETNSSFYALSTGENLDINFVKLIDIGHYDIIVIAGDYHRADWIFQKNIVIDADYVKLFLGAEKQGGSQTVATGLNALTNDATIETYDAKAFGDISPLQQQLIDALDRGDKVLTPNADWHLSGNLSGKLHILYIKGDYWDVNVIAQTNVISDTDLAVQQGLLPAAGTGVTQGVVSGANTVANDARIIDVGTLADSQYLGGEAYEESILVQTNIITDEDQVVTHDTELLVSEVVVFVGAESQDQEPDSTPCSVPDPANHDSLGNVMT